MQSPWLLHDLMLADPVFIIDNHDEVVHAATGHGNGDPSMYRNALGYVNDNQVIVFWYTKSWHVYRPSTKFIFYFLGRTS